MTIFNSIIRYMIQAAVVMIMVISLPMKMFSSYFEWREKKPLELRRKNKKDVNYRTL